MVTPKIVKAAKPYPEHDIAKGDEHWTWSLSGQGTQRSKTKPKNSQLTASEFWKTIYLLQERYADNFVDPDKIEDGISSIKTELEDLSGTVEAAIDDIPENFKDGPQAEKYRDRIEALSDLTTRLDAIEIIAPDESDERKAEWREEVWQEIKDALESLECD